MAAYLIVDVVRVHDPETYERYKQQVAAGLLAAGGRYLARGGTVDVLESDWKPKRLVVVRFDTAAAARHWWASDGYEPLRRMRQSSTDCNMLIVEGCTERGTP